MKPIIFNTEEVSAILDDRKTQARRVIKFPEGMTGRLPSCGATDYLFYPGGIKHPKHRPGDVLWVRETWQKVVDFPSGEEKFIYREYYRSRGSPAADAWKWRPSIHMPREAARLFLKVKAVRVERLQEITEDDCFAEGINLDDIYSDRECGCPTPRDVYGFMWNSLNAKKGYPYAANPWVWAVEFERTEEVRK